MSVYSPLDGADEGRFGRQKSFGQGFDDDALDEEEQARLKVLLTDSENDKLFAIMCNYLTLAQFELARSVLDQLFTLSPERCIRVLRRLVITPVPQKWCVTVLGRLMIGLEPSAQALLRAGAHWRSPWLAGLRRVQGIVQMGHGSRLT